LVAHPLTRTADVDDIPNIETESDELKLVAEANPDTAARAVARPRGRG